MNGHLHIPLIAVCQSTDNVLTNSTKPTGHRNNETSINGSSNNQRVESKVNVLTGETLPALSIYHYCDCILADIKISMYSASQIGYIHLHVLCMQLLLEVSVEDYYY